MIWFFGRVRGDEEGDEKQLAGASPGGAGSETQGAGTESVTGEQGRTAGEVHLGQRARTGMYIAFSQTRATKFDAKHPGLLGVLRFRRTSTEMDAEIP